MSVNANVVFKCGSFCELERLTKLIFFACLGYILDQKHNKIIIYYDYSYCGNGIKLTNIVPRIEYSDKMRYLLNVAVELNTPAKLVGICIKNDLSYHEIIEYIIRLKEDKEIGNYAQMF